jgi:hypothetical protein
MRRGLGALAAAAAVSLVAVPPASAAEEVGDRCVANDHEAGWTAIVMNNEVSAPFPPEVTHPEDSGVIVRWRTELKPGTGPIQQQLVAFQQAGALELRKIGESAVETLVDGRNEFAARVPVPPMSRIGLHGPVQTLFCDQESGHLTGIVDDPFAVGEARKYELLAGGVPAIAFVESDADIDGYGDESQDQCYGMPAFHEGCPAVVVSTGRAKVGKRAISVPVSIESPTAMSFAALVRITGQATLGKGAKSIFISSGGIQNLVPGSPLTIDVPLPKPLRQRLDGLSRKASLKAKLSIGLDNAAAFGRPPAKLLTVKLPGRKKSAPHKR